MEKIIHQQQKKQIRIVLFISVWTLSAVLLLLVLGSYYDFEHTLVGTGLNLLALIILFYGNLYLVNQFFPKQQYFQYLLFALPLCGVIIFLRAEIGPLLANSHIQPMILGNMRENIFNYVTSVAFLGFSILFQVYSSTLVAETKAWEAANEYNQAKIQFLKAQINPHFLFNALNNIYSLAVVKSDDTPEMLLKLSDLLRYVIYNSEDQKVALDQEIEHIFKFMDLFQMRSKEDLDIRLTVEGRLSGIMIEPMILIPLVENCFKHCDFDTNEDAYIEMVLIVENEDLTFKTLNSKNDYNLQKDKTGGVGLANIRKRLEFSYPNKHKLNLKTQEKSFEVELEITIAT